jgi:hypothetical protein
VQLLLAKQARDVYLEDVSLFQDIVEMHQIASLLSFAYRINASTNAQQSAVVVEQLV